MRLNAKSAAAVVAVSLFPVLTLADADAIRTIAERWAGGFNNHRQVEANVRRGAPAAPELTRERREMRVDRLDMPAVGDTVLYLEEYRATDPGVAHRQRLIKLVWDEKFQQVRAQQWFFRAGPTYDRRPLTATDVEKLAPSDFMRVPQCDLFFVWEQEENRYRGSMQRQACTYEHETSGMVYAEFDLLLYPDQQWYRDRSIKLATNSIRGEVDGFSWLLFDRNRAPLGQASLDSGPLAGFERALAENRVYTAKWEGTFRRFDADGALVESFPSVIDVRFDPSQEMPYAQTNRYTRPGGEIEEIKSVGQWRDGRLIFDNPRVEGVSARLSSVQDPEGRSAMLRLNFKGGSGMYMYEIITYSDDGKSRSRMAQYLVDGKIVRRTLIDETLTASEFTPIP